MGVDLPVVSDQPNLVKGGARDRVRKGLDVAHVDEGVRVALKLRVDPVPAAEPLRGRQIVREPEGDVDVGRLASLAADPRAEQNPEADVRPSERLRSHTRPGTVVQGGWCARFVSFPANSRPYSPVPPRTRTPSRR